MPRRLQLRISCLAAVIAAASTDSVAFQGAFVPRRPAALDPAAAGRANRLAHETSPYLLQHAHNPVDWYPWGDEAFLAARTRDVPIFLSVGYSTCYWCHVMERESFESAEIAALMNDHFVCIKVDREERPDVDDIYMSAVQSLSGHGGWPMSVFLEPQSLRPFYGGTYFPPQPAHGRPSFPQVLTAIAGAWRDQREAVIQQSEAVALAVRERLALEWLAAPLSTRTVDRAVEALSRIHDPVHGGFGTAPKFPQPVFLELLMHAAWVDESAQQAVRLTLDRMATGGMYDQVGGGFHRYSTDEKWLVPHFEKMLYDNGQLASIYAEAHERTGDAFYAEVLRGTLDYVLREMTCPAGGFFSAEDAEVDAREGLNYLWLPDEVQAALREAGIEREIEFALDIYGFKAGPNFRDPHHPEDGWKHVVFLRDRPEALASELKLSLDEFTARRARVNEALLAARTRRQQPGTDDKVLAGWNGLMIAGLADGGRVLKEPRYLDAARTAARFVLEHMRAPDGGLRRSWRDGTAHIAAFLEDHALVIRGLLALHRATGESAWLDHARELAAIARADFRDESERGGAFFDSRAGQRDLFIRTQGTYDGAVPSGNGVMALNLLELHARTGDAASLDDAKRLLRALSAAIDENPVSTALSTLALARLLAMDPTWTTGAPPAPLPAEERVVSISTSADRLQLFGDRAARLDVVITVADGYHINAHEPGAPGLIGLSIAPADAAGWNVRAEYPPPQRYRDEIKIYSGSITVPVSIRWSGAPGEAVSPLALQVTYQACHEDACLRPVTKNLAIDAVHSPAGD